MSGLLGKTSGFGLGLFDDFIAAGAALSAFVVMALVLAALLFAATHIFTGRVAWRKRRTLFVGMLCGMKDKELVWLSGQILRLLFVTATVCLGLRPTLPHMLLFAGLFAVEAASLPHENAGKLIFSFANNLVIFGAVLAADMLYGFMRDVRGDSRVMIVYVLTALFVVMYSLYFTLRDLCDMTEKRNGFSGSRGDLS
jgi:hypothetical protein